MAQPTEDRISPEELTAYRAAVEEILAKEPKEGEQATHADARIILRLLNHIRENETGELWISEAHEALTAAKKYVGELEEDNRLLERAAVRRGRKISKLKAKVSSARSARDAALNQFREQRDRAEAVQAETEARMSEEVVGAERRAEQAEDALTKLQPRITELQNALHEVEVRAATWKSAGEGLRRAMLGVVVSGGARSFLSGSPLCLENYSLRVDVEDGERHTFSGLPRYLFFDLRAFSGGVPTDEVPFRNMRKLSREAGFPIEAFYGMTIEEVTLSPEVDSVELVLSRFPQ